MDKDNAEIRRRWSSRRTRHNDTFCIKLRYANVYNGNIVENELK